MKIIRVQPLSEKKFAKYGEYQNLLDDASLSEKSIFPSGFYADVLKLDFGTSSLPCVSVCQVGKTQRMVVTMLEAHQFTCEGLLPLDDDVIIYAGTPFPGKKFSVENVEAFYVPKGTFVKLNPFILHGTQFPAEKETAHVLCLLPGRTFRNDMLAEMLPEGERAELVREEAF